MHDIRAEWRKSATQSHAPSDRSFSLMLDIGQSERSVIEIFIMRLSALCVLEVGVIHVLKGDCPLGTSRHLANMEANSVRWLLCNVIQASSNASSNASSTYWILRDIGYDASRVYTCSFCATDTQNTTR